MRIVAFGECMLELSGGFGEGAHLGFGGDTLNTALYLARLGAKVSYATALGHDSWSQEMRRAWSEEGIALDLVLTDPQRLPGLYAIQTDAGGERRFSYWRTNSAARHFFELPGAEQLLRIISTADLFYVSGISLSLYGDAERARLLDVAYAVRIHGGDVAFDPNYRPAGWSSPDQARSA
ncbi:MAG: sugar kinase, partial [Burkholderiales bacterium]